MPDRQGAPPISKLGQTIPEVVRRHPLVLRSEESRAIAVKELQQAQPPPLDLTWLDLNNSWGVRAKPGCRGLTLNQY